MTCTCGEERLSLRNVCPDHLIKLRENLLTDVEKRLGYEGKYIERKSEESIVIVAAGNLVNWSQTIYWKK